MFKDTFAQCMVKNHTMLQYGVNYKFDWSETNPEVLEVIVPQEDGDVHILSFSEERFDELFTMPF